MEFVKSSFLLGRSGVIHNRKHEDTGEEQHQKWYHAPNALDDHHHQQSLALEEPQGRHAVHREAEEHEPKMLVHVIPLLDMIDDHHVSEQLHPVERLQEIHAALHHHLNDFDANNIA